MAILTFNRIGITGVAASVPMQKIVNAECAGFFTIEEVQSAIQKAGIAERRVVDDKTCASDLCFAAAEALIEEMGIDRNGIDVLIFVSQTPDYRMPVTGTILQDRLGLAKTTAAFDINLGASGYVYGLALAYSYAQQESIRKVLLLDGETRTKVYSFKDKVAGLLCGDGGSATIVEKIDHDNPTYFSLNSDGGGSRIIWIKGGGYRHPSSAETLREKEHGDGSIRCDEQGVIDVAGFFEFANREIPSDMDRIFKYAGENYENIDFYLLHQADKFLNDQIAKKMKIPDDKLPYSIQKFGNTSSVSIPLTMVSEIRDELQQDKNRLFLSGFGAGLSWASAITSTNRCLIPKLVEI
jgi:3-oxoacyl-[acyl-carrier-protein] synthase-3